MLEGASEFSMVSEALSMELDAFAAGIVPIILK